MSSEQLPIERAELDPWMEFNLVLGMVRNRFHESVRAQSVNSAYRHFMLDRSIQTGDLTASFLLTEDVGQLKYGNSRTIELAVPIKDADIKRPELLDDGKHAYFCLGHITLINTIDGPERFMTTDVVNFETYQADVTNESSPIAQLMENLYTYQLMPADRPIA